MKLLGLLIALFVGYSAQADDSIIIDNTPITQSIELTDDTRLVIVELATRFAVNCPGQLNLESYVGYRGKVEVKYDDRAQFAVNNLIRNLSQSCQKEAFDYQTQPVFTCLSIGIESGYVYLDVRHLSEDVEVLEVEFPGILQIKNIELLK